MADRTFLLIYGIDGSGPGHWQHWLREKLEAAGETVRFPEFPDPAAPKLDIWLEVLDAELKSLAGQELVVMPHSLGVMMWLHYSARVAEPAVVADRVLLVAPTSPFFWEPRAEGFLPMSLDGVDLKKVARSTRIVSSDNDPYCPQDDLKELAKTLDVEYDVLPGAEHINFPAGYGEWPSVLDWALQDATPLKPR